MLSGRNRKVAIGCFSLVAGCLIFSCAYGLAVEVGLLPDTVATETAEAKEAQANRDATATIIALTPTDTPTVTPSLTSTPSPTLTSTPTDTLPPSATPLPSNTPRPSATPTATSTPTDTLTPTQTYTAPPSQVEMLLSDFEAYPSITTCEIEIDSDDVTVLCLGQRTIENAEMLYQTALDRLGEDIDFVLTIDDGTGTTEYDRYYSEWRITDFGIDGEVIPSATATRRPTLTPNPDEQACGSASRCTEMTSCQQAYACLRAGNSRLDSDDDGVPCESICPGG